MRKFFAVAMGSAVALLGFAGAANASATVELLWLDLSNVDTAGVPICLKAKKRNCPTLTTIGDLPTTALFGGPVAVSDNVTVGVIITAGSLGVQGAGVSVNFNDAIPMLGLTGFQRLTTTACGQGAASVPCARLPGKLAEPLNNFPGWITTINAAALPGVGLGLPAGETAYLGTVSFHKDQAVNGTFEIAFPVGSVDGALGDGKGPDGADGILALTSNPSGLDITGTTTFNSAWLINVPEPGALSLLVMGVGGMLLAGRGRRS
jgi:hypothetical protein